MSRPFEIALGIDACLFNMKSYVVAVWEISECLANRGVGENGPAIEVVKWEANSFCSEYVLLFSSACLV